MDRAKIIACVAAVLLAGCSGKPKIVVGSKNFTEQLVLGEIIAQHLERRLGVQVERKLNLGGTLLAHEALRTGAIDLYPEYTGTALTAVLKKPAVKDRAAALAQVREEYARQWKLQWLSPLGFNDTFAMMVRGETAGKDGITTLSGAAAKRPWKLGIGYEFQQRPDGLAGLVSTYGLKTAEAPVTMDLGLLYSALAGGKVDMIAANSTDGMASVMDVKILDDDKQYFPPYECAIVVRDEALSRFPTLRAVLEELAGKISDVDMRKLNYRVDGEHKSPASVAAGFHY